MAEHYSAGAFPAESRACSCTICARSVPPCHAANRVTEIRETGARAVD
ncbi:hypothetical protein [Amycolatopsis plumensis]